MKIFDSVFYQYFLKPFLFSLDAETAHNIVVGSLKTAQSLPLLKILVEKQFTFLDPSLEISVFGQKFRNPVGLAAGFDKNCAILPMLSAFGFGFVEGGTVTAQAQAGNPKPRLFRFPKEQALINRLGFNNVGAEAAAQQLQHQSAIFIPFGLNIGKSKVTPLEQAVEDYLFSFEKLYAYPAYITINVSSPNTPGLRDLQKNLNPLLSALQKKNTELAEKYRALPKPLLVKLAPDLEPSDLDQIAECCINHKVAGIIAVNTTVSREGIQLPSPVEGGLSGKPLFRKSTEILRYLYRHFGKKLILVGAGGIFSAEDGYLKIKSGASLVQIYTGWIYGGPSAVYRINQGLVQLLKKDGFKSVQEAVGADV